MNTFLIFVYADYYPKGGVHDLKATSDKAGLIDGLERALIKADWMDEYEEYDNYLTGEVHIYDIEKGKIVFECKADWAPDDWPPDQKAPTKSTEIERIKYELQKQMTAWH